MSIEADTALSRQVRLSRQPARYEAALVKASLQALTIPWAQFVKPGERVLLKPGGSLVLSWPSEALDAILVVTRAIGLTSPEMESQEHFPRLPVKTLQTVLSEIGFGGFVHKTFELGLNNLLVAHKPVTKETGL